jgi:hypothetical protein
MSKEVAIVAASGEVVNIVVQDSNYYPKPYEVIVTDTAWIGGHYINGFFYPPQPFPSWTRNEGSWQPPIPYPNDDNVYTWNEDEQSWDIVEL